MSQMRLPQMDAGELKDTKFMSADEKRKVLRHWVQFLESGLAKYKFTKLLYHHLMQHCSFIAHYDIHGFYDTYFTTGDDTNIFLSQFDKRNAEVISGVPPSIELHMTYWATGDEYGDVNRAMISLATPYIGMLQQKADAEQKKRDLELAQLLLLKHGINIDIK